MSDVSQNPSFHLSKPPHKLSNKHVLLKNKPTKKSSTTRSRNKNNNNNLMLLNNTNNNNNNNRPLKVVHISNPMRYQVAAAGFRALVQGLTGRDSVIEWPIDHHETGEVVAATTNTTDDDSGGNNSTDDHSSPGQQNDDDHQQINFSSSSSSVCFEPSDHHLMMSFDDYFGAHNFNADVTVPDDDDQFQQLYGCYGSGLCSPTFYDFH